MSEKSRFGLWSIRRTQEIVTEAPLDLGRKHGVKEQLIGLLLGVSILMFAFPIVGWLTVISLILLYRYDKALGKRRIKLNTYIILIVVLTVYQSFETWEYLQPEVVEFTPTEQTQYVDYIKVQVIENRDDIVKIEYQWSSSRADKPNRFLNYKSDVVVGNGYVDTKGLSRGAYYLICKVTLEDGTVKYADTDLFYITGKEENE